MRATRLDDWQAGIVRALDAYRGDRPIQLRDPIDVYLRNSIGARLSALRDTCPVLTEVLGARYFTALASRYVAMSPSTDPDLNRYGADFPNWLERQTSECEELDGLTYLRDLAALELAWSRAACAGQPTLASAPRPPDRVVLRPNPAMVRVIVRHAVLALWRRHRRGKPSKAVAALRRPSHLVVVRRQSAATPAIERLRPASVRLLDAVADGAPLSALAGRVSPGTLADCVGKGYLVGEPA